MLFEQSLLAAYSTIFSYQKYFIDPVSGFIIFNDCVAKIPFNISKNGIRGEIAEGTFIPQISVEINIFFEKEDGGEIGRVVFSS